MADRVEAASDIVRAKALTPDHTSVAAAAAWNEAQEIFEMVDKRIAFLRNELSRKEAEAPVTGADLYSGPEI